MSDAIGPMRSRDGVLYLDYSEFLGVPSGIILKNSDLDIDGIDTAIAQNVNFPISDKNSFFVKLNQKHTNVIAEAAEYRGQPADGVFSRSGNHLLTIRTADCFPLILYDGKTAAVLHLGWRSVLSGILDNFFHQVSDFNIRGAKVILGPGIGACCFEVSDEVALLFDRSDRKMKNGRYFIDLKGFILDELRRYGLKCWLDKGVCTKCNPEYLYSYRREGNAVKQMLSYVYPRRSK